MTKEIAQTITADQYRGLQTWDDVSKLLSTQGETYFADEVLGDGFALLADKGRLCGVPLIILEWRFTEGDHGPFVSARVAAQEQAGLGKYIINDGSTGIYQQLRDCTDQNGLTTLKVRKGLRRSDYQYEDVDSKTGEMKMKDATTYYIDTSA